MADISKITLPSGTTYDIKDTYSRSEITSLKSSLTGAMHYVGQSAEAITDGQDKSPINIYTINQASGNRQTVSYTPKSGDVVTYGNKEYVYQIIELGNISGQDTVDKHWSELGSTGSLKALAFKDTASGNFTPAGSVSVSTNATTNKTATVSATTGTATYTPAGTVSAPTITVTPNTTSLQVIDSVGTLPSFTATVSSETLTLGFSAGSVPTKKTAQTVVTGIQSATSTAPTFSGTGARLVTGNIPVPSTYTASFTGTQGTVTVS